MKPQKERGKDTKSMTGNGLEKKRPKLTKIDQN
jgi:hypothetical protein